MKNIGLYIKLLLIVLLVYGCEDPAYVPPMSENLQTKFIFSNIRTYKQENSNAKVEVTIDYTTTWPQLDDIDLTFYAYNTYSKCPSVELASYKLTSSGETVSFSYPSEGVFYMTSVCSNPTCFVENYLIASVPAIPEITSSVRTWEQQSSSVSTTFYVTLYVKGKIVHTGNNKITEYGTIYSSYNKTPTITDRNTKFAKVTEDTNVKDGFSYEFAYEKVDMVFYYSDATETYYCRTYFKDSDGNVYYSPVEKYEYKWNKF